MSSGSIHWHEGLFLQPHHLQTQARQLSEGAWRERRLSWPYPYLPRHLTIISTFTIGIPGFFLALAPNSRRYVPGFIVRVLRPSTTT